MTSYRFVLLVLGLIISIMARKTNAQCTLPPINFLLLRLENLLAAQSGEGSTPDASSLADPHYTCQAQGNVMGEYQHLSVVMHYQTTTGNNQNPRIGQFDLDCIGSGPEGYQEVSGSLERNLPGDFVDYVNLGTFTNCSDCDEFAGNPQRCVACDSACNVGLMRCTGDTSSDCCASFETNGMCSDNTNCTTENFVANEQNNYTCACGLDDSSCGAGETFNSTNCSCDFTDICMRDSPCQNGGTCMLNSAPDDFTCTCAAGFTGNTCLETITIASTSSSSSVSKSVSVSTSNVIPVTVTSASVATFNPSPSSSTGAGVGTPDDGPVLYAIIISAIIGFLLLVVLTIAVIYLLYYFLSGKGFAMAKAKANTPFSNGESHNNPLYLKPDEVTSEVATLYQP